MDSLKIGKHIAECRKEKGMTQSQLAEKLGVTNKTVSRWENGNYMPDLSLLVPLSSVLEISLDELLSGEASETISERLEKSEEALTKTIDYSTKKIKATKRVVALSLVLAVIACIAAVILLISNNNKNKLLRADGPIEYVDVDYALIKNNTVMMNGYSYLENGDPDADASVVWLNADYRLPLMTGYVVQVISYDDEKCEVRYPWGDTPAVYGYIPTDDVDMKSLGNIDYLWAKQSCVKSGVKANVYETCSIDSEVIGTITGPVQIGAMGEGWYWAQELVGGGNTSGFIRQEDLIEFNTQKIMVPSERMKYKGKKFAEVEEPVISIEEESSTLSKKDIFAAIDVVKQHFENEPAYSGCKLISLKYNEKWSLERSNTWKEMFKKDEFIGIDGSFTTDETVVNTSSFAPNYTYEDYTYVLGRDKGEGWELLTCEW